MGRWGKIAGLIVVAGLIIVGIWWPLPKNRPIHYGTPPAIPPFRHVFVIMMENHGNKELVNNPSAPYINFLIHHYGFDNNYYGLTHVSLPNYVGFLSGSTGGSHSDNPTQSFSQANLAEQLTAHHISWQAVMEGIPYPGYTGYWYPDPHNRISVPSNALYAKKHDPFLLFPRFVGQAKSHVVPLRTLTAELQRGDVPRFVWISPNLCHNMHGQISGPGATCPKSHPTALIRSGDAFLHKMVPAIMHSKAWTGNSVIFITWDETNVPKGIPLISPAALQNFVANGPEAPPIFRSYPSLGYIGGGKVPLIVLSRTGPRHVTTSLWADHYSVLKTIEDSWHLPFLGHAKSSTVPVLYPFFRP